MGVSRACLDPRYPALAGPFAVGCDRDGLVAWAQPLDSASRRIVALPFRTESPGLGPAAVYDPANGLALLAEDPVRTLDVAHVRDPGQAPPATDGIAIAVAGRDGVQAFDAGEKRRALLDAHPAGWYPPALVGPRVAWVEDAGEDGEDVWWAPADGTSKPEALAGGAGNQRHVVASGRWLAWVEEEAVVVLDTARMQRNRYAARTGFSAPIALWEDVACWEERVRRDGELDVDIRCSDGVTAGGPGNQRWPSRWDRWLLYREGPGREGQAVLLYTAAE